MTIRASFARDLKCALFDAAFASSTTGTDLPRNGVTALRDVPESLLALLIALSSATGAFCHLVSRHAANDSTCVLVSGTYFIEKSTLDGVLELLKSFMDGEDSK